SVTIPITPVRTSSDSLRIVTTSPLAPGSSPNVAEAEVILAPAGFANGHPAADRRRHLAVAIRQRIESRLGDRVRELAIRIQGNTVVLEGCCATYYTKQLAQHAALGVLEDEHLDNAIVVTM
ncbi:MAG TPA: hypothetical protein VJA26_11765, partial [Gammaproteobacteria bacterium]|nr:hypothetical protein [Gammaproteobacteria bacterium]